MFCTLTTVVRLTTTLLTTRGPPQPAHDGRSTKRAEPHHGTSGSPQPSATQLTNGLPTTARTPGAPKNATSAGAEAGRAASGAGAPAQKPTAYTQRPSGDGARPPGPAPAPLEPYSATAH